MIDCKMLFNQIYFVKIWRPRRDLNTRLSRDRAEFQTGLYYKGTSTLNQNPRLKVSVITKNFCKRLNYTRKAFFIRVYGAARQRTGLLIRLSRVRIPLDPFLFSFFSETRNEKIVQLTIFPLNYSIEVIKLLILTNLTADDIKRGQENVLEMLILQGNPYRLILRKTLNI